MSYMTSACWSQTRPGVFYTCKLDGTVDAWDLSFKQKEPVVTVKAWNPSVVLTQFVKACELFPNVYSPLGAVAESAMDFLQQLTCRIANTTAEARSVLFQMQHLSVAL